jgi:iron complex outermembrane receptor protein
MNIRKTNLIMTIGGGANQYSGDHFGRVVWSEYSSLSGPDYQYYFNEGNKTDLNQFVKAEYTLPGSVFLFADLQYRFINYRINGIDDDLRNLDQEHRYHFLNPKAGITWMIGPVSKTYVSYSVAHREPKRSNFTDAAPGSQVKPETLRDLEAGYQYNSGKTALGVTAYWMGLYRPIGADRRNQRCRISCHGQCSFKLQGGDRVQCRPDAISKNQVRF